MSERSVAGSSSNRAVPSSGHRKKRTQKSIRVACNECRRRKIACDGVKPICGRCRAHERTCVYEFDVQTDETRQAAQSRAREDAYQQLADIAQTLQTLSTVNDTDLVRLSRNVLSAPRPIEALAGLHQQQRGSSSPSPISSRASTPRPLPDGKSELARLHPAAYPSSTQMLESVFCDGFPTMSDPRASLTARLSGLNISFWTNVQLSDTVAIELISEFLATEHLILALFETDHFVVDLVAGRTRFCSELLVAAIMFTTCQSRAGSSPHYRQLRAEFLADARRLWADARKVFGAITLAASQLLLYACIAGGVDDLTDDVQQCGEQMSDQLNSLGQNPTLQQSYRPALTSEELEGMAHVAWSTFNISDCEELVATEPRSRRETHPR